MSVLIKGMEMPKNCKKCMFADFDDVEFDYELYCAVSKKYADLDACDHPLGWSCPLVEVKDPHGRLIDADEIEMPCLETTADQKWMEIAIKSTPTVIEAEGREE